MQSFAAGYSSSGVRNDISMRSSIGMRLIGARDIGGYQVEVVLRLGLDLVQRAFLGSRKKGQNQRSKGREAHDGKWIGQALRQ